MESRKLASMLLLAATCGCSGSDDASPARILFVRGPLSPSSPPECGIPTGGRGPRPAGILDLSVADRYVAFLWITTGSRVVDLPCPESSWIFVEGARVRYEVESWPGLDLPATEIRTSVAFECYGATVATTVIDEATSATIAALASAGTGAQLALTVFVEFRGVDQGGDPVASEEYPVPITVCDGCLVECPVGVDADPSAPECQCDCASTTPMGDFPCLVGQDDPVDCRLVSGCTP